MEANRIRVLHAKIPFVPLLPTETVVLQSVRDTMISAVSWIPKGASKPLPEEADPPSKEEIDELIKSGALDRR